MRIPHTFRGHQGPDNSTMTPMIDVVFLLLIFFICASARQVREALLPANLPPGALNSPQATEAAAKVDEAHIKLKRADSGEVQAELNGNEPQSLDALEGQLRALAEIDPNVPVIMDVDGPVPFGEVIRIYDLCQRVHFQTIKFAIDPRKVQQPQEQAADLTRPT